MKVSAKRRRTKQEILETKRADRQKQMDIEEKMSELEALKQQMAEMQQYVENAKIVEKQCNTWAEEGIMK